MRRATRKLLIRGVPLLLCGIAGLALLPGTSTSKASVVQPSRSTATVVIAKPAPQGLTPAAAALAAALGGSTSGTSTNASPTQPANAGIKLASLESATAAEPSPAASQASSPTASTGPATTADVATQPATDTTTPPSDVTDGRIGARAVNARTAPQSGSPIQFVLAAGEPVKLGEIENGWRHVYRADGTNGWVYNTYVGGNAAPPRPETTAAAAPTRSTPQRSQVMQTTQQIAVWDQPGDGAELLFVLGPHVPFHIDGRSGRWLRVVTEDGATGWIPA